MKRFLVIAFIFVCSTVHAAAPSRQNTYTANTVISSSDVTANEDAIFNYLQAGVDTYSPLSIENADVGTSANIQSDKLNLTSIAQAVSITSAGSLTVEGSTTLSGTNTFSGTTEISGALTVSNTSTFASQTITDLGSVTTADINGGTVDGVTIGGSSAGTGSFTSLTLSNAVTEFSTDGTLGGNSDSSVPTEKAVKTYADTKLSGFGSWTGGTFDSSTQAGSDLLIVVYGSGSGGTGQIRAKADGSNPPTTIVGLSTSESSGEPTSLTFAVKNGDYYLAENVGTGGDNFTVNVLPLN